MTSFTEEQLREIAETLLGETRTHLLQRQGMFAVMMYVAPERVVALARQCLDLMDREKEFDTQITALDAKVKALAPHTEPFTCGCSYDGPNDVCSYHSPQLRAALARAEAAEALLRDAVPRLYNDQRCAERIRAHLATVLQQTRLGDL